MHNEFYVVYNVVGGNVGSVHAIITNVDECQLVDNSFYVDEIPQSDNHDGMRPNLRVRIAEKELYYDYEAIIVPPTRDEMAEKLQELQAIVEEKDRENKNALFEIYNLLGGA